MSRTDDLNCHSCQHAYFLSLSLRFNVQIIAYHNVKIINNEFSNNFTWSFNNARFINTYTKPLRVAFYSFLVITRALVSSVWYFRGRTGIRMQVMTHDKLKMFSKVFINKYNMRDFLKKKIIWQTPNWLTVIFIYIFKGLRLQKS